MNLYDRRGRNEKTRVRRAGIEKTWLGANHLSGWILRSRSGLEPCALWHLQKRMIVVMMEPI